MDTDEERRARLEHLSANQHLRLAAETNSEGKKWEWIGFDLDLIWIEIGVFQKKIFFQGMSLLAL